ncbi:MAG: UbiX family flavin prenyltransferase [Chitinophagaceae bacterium]|nr:UbiX family flavin prenyltransferase [Chitinophagaceae bacterium]
MKHKMVIAISGASGSVYAKVLLDKLLTCNDQIAEVGIVMSANAKKVWETELGNQSYLNYPFRYFEKHDFNAPFASGSAKYNSMIVVPCSMGTLGRIASGVSDDLVTRAADVILKERRKLILMVRDTPYNLIHIRNMETVTLAGGIICPCSPSFYSKPENFESMAATVVDRALELTGFELNTYRWGSPDI